MKAFLYLLLSVALVAAEPKKGGLYSGGTVTCQQFQEHFHKVTGQYMTPAPESTPRALVRYEALDDLRKFTWRNLSKAYGIRTSELEQRVTWDTRFDCVALALAANLELRARLMSEYWMASTEARRPACVIVFYRPDHRPDGLNHAILFIVTDQGPVWWDPVSGLRMLTAEEVKSVYPVTP